MAEKIFSPKNGSSLDVESRLGSALVVHTVVLVAVLVLFLLVFEWVHGKIYILSTEKIPSLRRTHKGGECSYICTRSQISTFALRTLHLSIIFSHFHFPFSLPFAKKLLSLR